jgi:chromosome condensin MukBEF MukE localization factor
VKFNNLNHIDFFKELKELCEEYNVDFVTNWIGYTEFRFEDKTYHNVSCKNDLDKMLKEFLC